ncbi:Benzoate-para-hydroxylase [Hyphodiscus hymeniophilus]|uniref:Benzoate-para-hydroxylase n=1 Tax=Hyphodiscus hymeniophilus TaxID=353542 RepID=A0A9P6SPV5_9HELO|nr:Benzoate-para-hydroxylase [Hyphodiscus hymeniophilus]
MISISILLSGAFASLFAYFVIWPVVVYFLDPLDLRKYPSPSPLASIYPLWLVYETWMERRSATVYEAHQRLGDIIRVGPDQILFNKPQAISDIYGHLAVSKVSKDSGFYDKTAGDMRDIVNERDRAEHSRKRRYMANSFALKTVVDMEPVITTNAQNLLARLDSYCRNPPTGASTHFNIRMWFNYFTLDVIGDMAFGLPMGFLKAGTDTKTAQTQDGKIYEVPSTIHALQQGVRYTITTAQILNLEIMRAIKRLIRCNAFLRRVSGAQSAEDFENVCIHQLRSRLAKGIPERESRDFVDYVLTGKEGAPRALPFRELVAEAQVMMNAGSDTTAAAITSTMYHLLSNPECLAKLRQELETKISPEDLTDIVPYDLVRELPYLRACIDETLRLRPPIAYPLQRRVYSPDGATIAGHHIKTGTVVAVPTFTIHRKADLFPQPERFNPDRWLNKDDEEQMHNLRSYVIPFSMGSRACIGRHIAIVELQILVSSLIRRYNMELEHEGQELEIHERFNSNPGPMPIRIQRRAHEVV